MLLDSHGGKEKTVYHNQSALNFKRAIKNLKHIDLQDQKCHPDYNKPLSVREFEILYLASNGLSNTKIALILSISSHTVKSHFDHIFNKLGVSNRTMAVYWAAQHGLIKN
jgi:ATP/maltotriose-dependent transcriptional regulator MalT